MTRKLWVRLSAAFLLVVLVAMLVVTLALRLAVETSFRGYISHESQASATTRAVEILEAYYAEHGTLQGALAVLPGSAGKGPDGARGEQRGVGQQRGGVQYIIVGADRHIIAAADIDMIGEVASTAILEEAAPLRQGDQVIGWVLAIPPRQSALSTGQTQFLNTITLTLILVSSLVGGLAVGVGILVSRVLAQPLQELTEAAQALAEGNLGRQARVRPESAAEIALLAGAFNRMSKALADSEALRQRMATDIAHELRTPLSVMRVQLQSMMDEVRPPSIETIAIVYDQTLHLSRLVEDLRTLTLAEAGHLPLKIEPLDPADLLNRAARLFEPLADDAGLHLEVEAPPGLPQLNGDPHRLQQVLANLLANALRHTKTGGSIILAVRLRGDRLRFSVTNSGATLTSEQAQQVFERFWRADESKQRDQGGTGLGLPIARQIIQLHGGTIWVEVNDHWTHFIFELPALAQHKTVSLPT